jgi:hypothetical protein
MEEVTDLNHSQRLRELLIMYVGRKYEENARFDDWYLFEEYKLLKKYNELDDLFKEECLTNRLNDKKYRIGDEDEISE